jgi:hypothetical protein
MRVNLSNRQGFNMPIPQPGEIWEVSRLVQSPIEFSSAEQQTLYSSSVQRFLAGNSPPRYVMIVNEPETSTETQEQWSVVSVMLLSVKTEFLSDADLLITTEISGLEQDLLAETWNVVPALACNLLKPFGKRLTRQIYDYLLALGDYYHGLIHEPPVISEIQHLGLVSGSLFAAKDSRIQDFHKKEEAWSDVLTMPVAAYQTYLESIKFTNAVLDEALDLEQE